MKTTKDSILFCVFLFIFSALSGNATAGIVPKDSVLNASLAGKTFSATQKDKNVVNVRWIAAKEQATRKFIIERSSNGRMFYPIGEISAAVSGKMNQEYNFADAAPVPGENFYRLKQVSIDGSTNIFGISFVEMEINSDLIIEEQKDSDKLLAKYLTNKPVTVNFIITDVRGKIMLHNTMNTKEGENPIVIFTKDLAKGQYFLSAESAMVRNTIGFVK